MILPLLVLGSVTLAQQQQQPYIMQKASDAMVNYAVKYRNTHVADVEASSAAAQVVASILAPSQATDLVKSAASYYAINGPVVSGQQAEALASKASSYYDELATKPAYKSFAALVAEKTPLFDISRAASDAQNLANSIATKQPQRANKALVQATKVYSSLKSDPAGAGAIETGKSLAKKVASDFQVDSEKVKSNFRQAKQDFVNLLLRTN